ncbi:MAG: phosphopantetheine-binding protein [Pirellulaceae bacterium]
MEHVKQCLPTYVTQPSFVEMVSERFHKRVAGKTDYKSFSQRLKDRDIRVGMGGSASPPRTPLEQRIADAWREVLQTEVSDRDLDFFQLGGNSLQAAQLVSRFQDQFSVQVPMRRLYDSSTAAIAEMIIELQLQCEPSDGLDLLTELESLSDDEILLRLKELE